MNNAALKNKLPLCIFLALIACNCLKAQDLPRGTVIPGVSCLSDTGQHYALYLPSIYDDDPEYEFPVIYAFDAAARGTVAVELFREAAEKFGYIIAGSNVSENGPWEPILKASETMMKDVEARFRIDQARRHTAGFSGGARVASSLAVLYGTFEGVIGCGAGFSPNYPPHFDLEFCYFGIIGNRDFNYQEMLRLDDWLSKFNIDHQIHEFAGGHEWPPAEVLSNAVLWLEFKAMKNDLKWVDYGMREDYYEDRMKMIQNARQMGNTYFAYNEAVELKNYLDGVRRLDDVDSIVNGLKNDEKVKAESANLRRILEEERGYYKSYNEAFSEYRRNYEDGMTEVKPLSWWKEQVKIAGSKIDQSDSQMEYLLGRRMIDFIWRMAYQQYEAVMGTELEPVARNYLEIWAIVQPDAISPYFYLAKYYTSQGKYPKALNYLKEAVDKGLDDPALVEGDTVLVRLTYLPEYQPIGARIRD
jgi:tetratricopeptide (TPR) repeat protein